MPQKPRPFILSLFMAALLSACQGLAPEDAGLVFRPAKFSALSGWSDDHQAAALRAFALSCTRILTAPPAESFGALGGTFADWKTACTRAQTLTRGESPLDDKTARAYFEEEFTPWHALADTGAREGLFTGYYEASLRGSRTRHGAYQTPLRRRPGDLVSVNLGDFRPSLKGQRIAGRVVEGKLKPYENQEQINAGKLPDDSTLALVWVDDPVKAFFLQIQGSGRVFLDDGTVMRVGYAGQNGWPYYAIGRELVKRGALKKDNVSMQSIEHWLKTHPGEAQAVMETNPSYVFFKELDGPGPLGAENIPLTPGRSLAVDHARVPYGIPIWLSVNRHLMVAQDTGGAIRGPVRGDVFFGFGPEAEQKAGVMKDPGQWWFLLPRAIQPKPLFRPHFTFRE